MAQDLKKMSLGTITATDGLTDANITNSCLMRIADASEAMAGNFLALQRENAELKNSRQYWIDRADVRDRTIINMKGQITKLKNKIQQLKEPNLSNV